MSKDRITPLLFRTISQEELAFWKETLPAEFDSEEEEEEEEVKSAETKEIENPASASKKSE